MSVIKKIMPGIFSWSEFNAERQLDFNGYYLIEEGESVLIDPPTLDREGLAELRGLLEAHSDRPLKAIVLTNVHHDRMSADLKQELKVPVFIHELDKPLLEFPCDGTFADGDRIFCGLRVVHFPNQKSPGECGLLLENRRILIVGDALIGKVPGKVNLLPPEKYSDVNKARRGLERLRDLDFETLLVGDGHPILGQAKQAVLQFLDS